MGNTYGYNRTSRQRIAVNAGSARNHWPCSSAGPVSVPRTSIATWVSRAASEPTALPASTF